MNSCYHCTRRKPGCHSVCEDYKRDCEEYEQRRPFWRGFAMIGTPARAARSSTGKQDSAFTGMAWTPTKPKRGRRKARWIITTAL